MAKSTDFKFVSVQIKQCSYRESNIVNRVVTWLMMSRNLKVKVRISTGIYLFKSYLDNSTLKMHQWDRYRDPQNVFLLRIKQHIHYEERLDVLYFWPRCGRRTSTTWNHDAVCRQSTGTSTFRVHPTVHGMQNQLPRTGTEASPLT